jgi:AcrR family transcriptional regulator
MASQGRREDVLEAATRVFLRFGYRRTTMGDIAEEAGISRPGLYPLFPSKEEIFSAVLARALHAELDEIRAGVAEAATPAEKLMLALEVWCVQNYELTRSSPGAADLFESSFEFASEVASKSTAAFEAILAEVLAPLVRRQSRVTLTAHELARLLSGAVVGLKATAKSAKQLRASLRGLVSVVLASLGQAT